MLRVLRRCYSGFSTRLGLEHQDLKQFCNFLVSQPNNRWSALDSFTCICVAHPSAKYSWDAHSSFWASPLCSSLCFGTLLCRVQTHKPPSLDLFSTHLEQYTQTGLQLDAPPSGQDNCGTAHVSFLSGVTFSHRQLSTAEDSCFVYFVQSYVCSQWIVQSATSYFAITRGRSHMFYII